MRKTVGSICLLGSLGACGRGATELHTAPFDVVSHTRIEGDVKSLNGTALPDVVLDLSLPPDVLARGYIWNIERSDKEGRFAGTVGRLVGLAPAAGVTEAISVFLVATAPTPRYPLTSTGAPIRDSVPVQLILVGPKERPPIFRAQIELPIP